MTEQRREMEALKHNLPITPFPQAIFTGGLSSFQNKYFFAESTQNSIFYNILNTADFRPVSAVPQMASTKAVRQPPPLVSSPDSTELQARLALLRHTAEKVTNALLTKSSAYNQFKVQ